MCIEEGRGLSYLRWTWRPVSWRPQWSRTSGVWRWSATGLPSPWRHSPGSSHQTTGTWTRRTYTSSSPPYWTPSCLDQNYLEKMATHYRIFPLGSLLFSSGSSGRGAAQNGKPTQLPLATIFSGEFRISQRRCPNTQKRKHRPIIR